MPTSISGCRQVAAVARSEEDFGVLAKSEYWPVSNAIRRSAIWSDDYSNVLGALMRKWKERARLTPISVNK